MEPELVRAHDDPLVRARGELVTELSEAAVAALDAEVEAEVADAVAFADASPEPTADVLEPTTYSGPFAR